MVLTYNQSFTGLKGKTLLIGINLYHDSYVHDGKACSSVKVEISANKTNWTTIFDKNGYAINTAVSNILYATGSYTLNGTEKYIRIIPYYSFYQAHLNSIFRWDVVSLIIK